MNEILVWLYVHLIVTTIECITVSMFLSHTIGPFVSLLVLFNIFIIFNIDLYEASHRSRYLKISVAFTVLLSFSRVTQVNIDVT